MREAQYDASTQYMITSLKGSALLNGGATVTFLGLMTTSEMARKADLFEAIIVFAIAAWLSVVAPLCLSFTEALTLTGNHGKATKTLTALGGGAIGTAMTLFVFGCLSAYAALKDLV